MPSLAEIMASRSAAPQFVDGPAPPPLSVPDRQSLAQLVGAPSDPDAQRRPLSAYQQPPLPRQTGTRLADFVDHSSLQNSDQQQPQQQLRHKAAPSRRDKPRWVEGSFSTVSRDHQPPPPSSYASRAPNKTLRPTSNNLFGVQSGPHSPVGGTQPHYTTTQQDLKAHAPTNFAVRAPNYSLQPGHNIYDRGAALGGGASAYTTTQQDLRPHTADSFARRAPNHSLRVGHSIYDQGAAGSAYTTTQQDLKAHAPTDFAVRAPNLSTVQGTQCQQYHY